MSEPVTTTRVIVQEWYADCWMQRVIAIDLADAKSKIAIRLEEWPEKIYRAVEETTTVERKVIIEQNEPGKPKPKSRKKDDGDDGEPADDAGGEASPEAG